MPRFGGFVEYLLWYTNIATPIDNVEALAKMPPEQEGPFIASEIARSMYVNAGLVTTNVLKSQKLMSKVMMEVSTLTSRMLNLQRIGR